MFGLRNDFFQLALKLRIETMSHRIQGTLAKFQQASKRSNVRLAEASCTDHVTGFIKFVLQLLDRRCEDRELLLA